MKPWALTRNEAVHTPAAGIDAPLLAWILGFVVLRDIHSLQRVPSRLRRCRCLQGHALASVWTSSSHMPCGPIPQRVKAGQLPAAWPASLTS